MKKDFKIILVGAPGSGKGTISNILCKKYNLKHISTGNLFREKIKADKSDLALEITNILNKGELVPDEITNKLVKQEILKCFEKKQGFILDGYPRNIEQANFLNDICNIDFVFCFNIDKNELYKRISGRLVCSSCGAIFNTYLKPPKVAKTCDNCGEVLFQRKDDNFDSFKLRMSEYNKKTKPLINFFKNLNKLDKINVGKSIDEVIVEIEKVLNAN